MAKHTQEPWITDETHLSVKTGDGSWNVDGMPLDMIEWERARVCVNAMAGVSDPGHFMRCADMLHSFVDIQEESEDGQWWHSLWKIADDYHKARTKATSKPTEGE